jgi:membrane protease YdiL (CAAX protease family)
MNDTRQAIDGQKYLQAGLISLIPAIAVAAGGSLGWDQDIASLISMGLVIPVLFWLIPEPVKFGTRSIVLFLVGLAVGAVSFWFRYHDQLDHISATSSNGLLGVWVYAITMVILIPLWEEKSCRQILFFGLGKYLNLWLSALLISAVFAWVHRGSELFAFFFSLAACGLAARGVGTFDRALLHGGINLLFVALYFYYGYQAN